MKMAISLIVFLALILFALGDLSFAATDTNLQSIMIARDLFKKNELDKAYAEYDKIEKKSDFWLESIEEKAHIMGRKGEYSKALGLLQTVVAEPFNGLVGPEPFFVQALTHLKICDYSSVFEDTKLFKERFVKRAKDLNLLASSQDVLGTKPVIEVIQILDSKKTLTAESIGANAKYLPRNFHRDAEIVKWASQSKSMAREVSLAERIKILAQRELKEIESVVNKMQIAEAEVIQRIYIAENSNGKREQQGEFKNTKNTLSFPVSKGSKEIWMDELEGFNARVEKCPTQNKRAGI